MLEKDLIIGIPIGYEVDEEKSTFTHIVFKPEKKKVLPTKWYELFFINGYFVNEMAEIRQFSNTAFSPAKNVFPTRKLAEASLALAQLLQLRDVYNDGWVADWSALNVKHSIVWVKNDLRPDVGWGMSRSMSFKTQEIRDEFLKNFRELLMIAKPLL